jgi:hypothetical protein
MVDDGGIQDASWVDCPSVFGRKAEYVSISALKKRKIPKFKAFSNKMRSDE